MKPANQQPSLDAFTRILLAAWIACLFLSGILSAAGMTQATALLNGIKESCRGRQADPGHGFTVLPVAQAILKIKDAIPEIRQADPVLAQVAALLHDIGGGGPPGEVAGPPIAREVLIEQQCEPRFIDQVCRIIATHHRLKGELVKGLDDTPEWFVVMVADRLQVIEQHQRAPGDSEALTRLVAENIAKLKRDVRWTEPATTISIVQNESRQQFLPPLPAGQEWKLIWNDEFEGVKLDETKWKRLGDWKRRDGFWVKEDAYLSGHGTLLLRTKQDGDRYTCGAVNTQGKFERAFGYYVARCKMPKQPGHWPAFWMMGRGVGTVGNEGRDGTEIDIMEIPWRNGKVTFNLHWDGYGDFHKSAGTNTVITVLTEGFHDYALLWTPEEYVFYVDGKEVWRTRAGGVSQVPEYLKLTEEIGKWGGDITKAQLPDYFEVDYVRVFEMSK